MGNRSRKERRAHQQERAVGSGDVASLRALVEKSPRSAVAALARALASPPAEADKAAELEALAAGVAGQVRRGGDPAEALALAAAGQRRTPGLRMEEALAAFAVGRDDLAAEIAASDAAVALALGPLLQAVRGEVAAASPGVTPALRALHAVARATGHLVRGEPEKSRAITQRLTYASRRPVLGEEMIAAADLVQPGRALQGVEQLLRSPRATAQVQRLMMAEAALTPDELASLTVDLDPSVRARTLHAQMAEATSPGAVVEVVRSHGVDAFDVPERAAAALYHGFSLLRAQPEAAARSLDRAIQLGADLIEALRGKVLALEAALRAYEPFDPAGDRARREAASAADRLARALERLPLGGPLAGVAGLLAARGWLAVEDPPAVFAAVARARPFVGGKLVDDLDLVEADATGFRDLKEAERLVDVLLARSPGFLEAWRLKSSLAHAQGDYERAETLLVEAAAATKDPDTVAQARKVQAARGQLVPFDGFVPGAATVGALARELARATTELADPFPLAAPHREALASSARFVFDAAALVIAAVRGSQAMVEARLADALRTWRGAHRELAQLVAVAILVDLAEGIPAAALALGDDPPALRVVGQTLAVAGQGKILRRILPGFAAILTRAEVTSFKTFTAGKRRAAIAGIPTPERAAYELDRALAPELSLLDLISGPAHPAEPEQGQGGFIEELFVAAGMSPGDLGEIPPEVLRAFEKKLLAMTGKPPSAELMNDVLNIIHETGGSPFGAPRPPKKKR